MEGHRSPIQSLADAITMEEFKTEQTKVVLSWAPRFASSCQFLRGNDAIARADFVITHPEGYELNPKLLKTPRLSTIRIKHLKMLILSIKTGAVTKITVKSLITTQMDRYSR
jgi:ornithine carbamoyltransferase